MTVFFLALTHCTLFVLAVVTLFRSHVGDSARISELQKEREELEAEIEFKRRALEEFKEIMKDARERES